MATVVQATEHVLVETATAVVSSLGAAATAEFKTIESGIAQEAVSATDDGVSNIIHKVESAVETVVEEVVNGAEHVVEAVKQHPELIAEGALAVAIGVASLVQPELIAGEVAILGKMAADSAKKTVTQIASDEGQKIVKAISKDLTEDAKAEAEKDKIQAEEKRKAEGGEVAADGAVVGDGEVPKAVENAEVKPVTRGDKTIAIEIQSPAPKTEEGAKDSKVETEAAPVQLKITIGSDGEIKAVSKSVAEEAKPAEKTVEEKSAVPAIAENIETPAAGKVQDAAPAQPQSEIAQVAGKTPDLTNSLTSQGKPEQPKATAEKTSVETIPSKPETVVSQIEQKSASPAVKEVQIPIEKEALSAQPETAPGSAVQVVQQPSAKVVTKETESPSPKPVVEKEKKPESAPVAKAAEEPKPTKNDTAKVPTDVTVAEKKETVEPEILSVLGIVHSDVAQPSTIPQSGSEEQTSAPEPEKADSFVEQLLHRSNSGDPVLPVDKADEKTVTTPLPASIESVPEVNQEPSATPAVIKALKTEIPDAIPVQSEEPVAQPPVSATSTEQKPSTPSETAQQTAPEVTPESPEQESKSTASEEKSVPSALSQAKDLAVSALSSSAAESGPNIATAVASVTNITTTTTKTVEVPSEPGVKMVTVSQESLDILHSKLDAMHEAIQLITKTLATHLPPPQASAPVVVKQAEVESTPVPTPEVVQGPTTPAVPGPSTQEAESSGPTKPKSTTTDSTTPDSTTTTTDSPEIQSTTTTTPKRPTHVKRGSVIGSIGKFLWPFGGSAPAPTPVSKDAAVKASTLEVSSEAEVQVQVVKPKSSGRDSAPGPELTKASSTVEVTEVMATPVAV